MTEVPRKVQGQLPGGDQGAKPPEADDIFSKRCINTLYTEVLDNICSKKIHVSTFSGGQMPPSFAPLPMPVGAHACCHAKMGKSANPSN